MAKKSEYDVACNDAATSSTGTMQCVVCGKKITEGKYLSSKRSAEGDWRYVTRHYGCSADHPAWKKHHAELEAQKESRRKYEIARERFLKKWEHFIDDE